MGAKPRSPSRQPAAEEVGVYAGADAQADAAAGESLLAAGQARQALPFLAGALLGAPDRGPAWRMLAQGFLQDGRPRAALDVLEVAVQRGVLAAGAPAVAELRRQAQGGLAQRGPAPGRAAVERVLGAAREGRLQAALAHSQALLDAHSDHPLAWTLRGDLLRRAGAPGEAEACFRSGLACDPDSPQLWSNLGDLKQSLGASAEAADLFGRAVNAAPHRPALHVKRAAALAASNRADLAETHLRHAIRLRPTYAEAHNDLLELLQQSGDKARLDQALDAARQACPDSPLIALSEARVLRARGHPAEARARLEGAPGTDQPPQWRAARAALLGAILDAEGEPARAFEQFQAANDLTAGSPEGRGCDRRRYLALLQRITAALPHTPPRETPPAEPEAPAFLVGFPRSGTTLLDSVLRSHAGIEVVEERPAVTQTLRAFEATGRRYPEELAGSDAATLAELRRTYRSALLGEGPGGPDPAQTLVVDKLPLNLIHADLIAALYPGARVVFALRHPCDCVLSCFMQSFRPNDAMASFWSLEHAAELYDAAMRLWQRARSVLPLHVVEVRYEDVVTDFDGTVARMLEGLGQPWDDDVRRFFDTAAERARIDTPSYEQVTRPLYREAAGRWRRYRAQMEPVLPRLAPWCETFGYEL